ncbi:MAG: ASKHA domain-containing protein [Thermodesulfovibrionales bacterium]
MKKRISITVHPQELTLEAAEGESLLGILVKAGLQVSSCCGGRGTCGKCKVRVSGTVPRPSAPDLSHLTTGELDRGMRLSCCTIPEGGEVVECSDFPAGSSFKVALDTVSFPVDPWRKEDQNGFVLAVDLGTTNIVGHVIDPFTGRVVSSAGKENRQAAFGADVMSRLSYASIRGNEGREAMRAAALSDMEKLVEDSETDRPVTDVIAVMNTAMEVLLLGRDPDLLGRYPCDSGIKGPVHLAPPFTAKRLQGAVLHLPPVIGGFVGSDTVAALSAIEMLLPDRPYVLVDIGTNAEVVVVTGKEMTACSTAAGPAFEGMGITCGMRGVTGAIDRVFFDEGDFRISVIGGGTARGITGSGLFSLIGELLRAGALDTLGLMQPPLFLPDWIRRGKGGNEVILAPGVTVSEHDVQQFLLAKAATRAAVDTLLDAAEVKPEEVTAFYLAGTFAGTTAPHDFKSVGLIPPGRVRGVGNAAAVGAALMAASESAFRDACLLAGRIRHRALSGSSAFMDAFQAGVHF